MRGLVGLSWIVCCLAAHLTIVGPVAAQQAEATLVLTLRDVLSRAVSNSPQYRQAVNRMSLEGPQRRQAWGAFLPDLSLSFGTSQGFSRQTTAEDNFGNPIENPVQETIYSSGSDQGVSVGIDLFQGGRRFHAISQARAQADEIRRAGEEELNNLLAEVQRQFLQAQRQRALLALEEELLAGRERDLEVTRRLYDLASKNRSDLLGTESNVETKRVDVRRVRGEYQKALLGLRRAMGDSELREFEVDAVGPQVFAPTTLDIDEVVGQAMEVSPLVLQALATTRISQASLDMQRSSRWPSLSLTGGVSRGSFGRDQSALFDLTPDGLGGRLSLSMSIPLFRRFETSYQIAEADVGLRNSMEAVRQTELEVEETVRARFVDLDIAWSTLQEGTRALELAEERLRIVREEYRLIAKDFEDLQAAERDAAEQRRSALDRRFDFANALLDLHQAAGIVAQEAGLSDPDPSAN